MRPAVDLDDQPRIGAEEIHDIGSDRVLAAEARAKTFAAKSLPQHDFRQRHRAAQLAGVHDLRTQHLLDAPSTALRAVPLPVPGRIEYRHLPHIRNTPNAARSGTGAFSVAANASPSTSRVWAGSMMPSSHSRAVA